MTEEDDKPKFLSFTAYADLSPADVKKLEKLTDLNEASSSLLAISIRERGQCQRAISYSRNAKRYAALAPRYRHSNFTHRKVVRAVEELERKGFIIDEPSKVGWRGHQSEFRPSEHLIDLFGKDVLHRVVRFEPGTETIRLKVPNEDGTREFVDYKDNRLTRSLRRDMHDLNHHISGSVILDGNAQDIGSHCVRSFVHSFKQFGRIYARGHSWQNLRNKDGERSRISINGDPVIEVDYCSLAVNQLRLELGLSSLRDAYSIGERWAREIINLETGEFLRVGRNLVKIAFQVALNASTHRAALRCISYLPEMTAYDPSASLEDRDSIAEALLADLEKFHSEIAHRFYTMDCARLQRADSDIANHVLKLCRKQGVLALPIHDSFLVQRQNVGVLEAAMEEAAGKFGYAGLPFKQSWASAFGVGELANPSEVRGIHLVQAAAKA